MAQVAHLVIDYTEGDAESYAGIHTHSPHQGVLGEWRTGDPIKDWQSFLEWRSKPEQSETIVIETSSVTHFLMDIPGYRMVTDNHGREVMIKEDRPQILREEAAERAAKAAGLQDHQIWIVEVACLVDFDALDPEDRDTSGNCSVDGSYMVILSDYIDGHEEAIDLFHKTVPIASLEDFHILCRPATSSEARSGPDAFIRTIKSA